MPENIPENVPEDSEKCPRKLRGMFKKIPGNAIKDSGECSRRFRGLFGKIPGNVQENYGECFGPNPFNFKLIKTTFYLKKANAKLILGAWSIFAMSNETIGRSNKIIWYFHFFFFLIQNEKKLLDHGGKQREEKLKTKTNRRRKRNKEIRNKSNMYYIRAGKNFNNYTPQLFQNMIDRSYMPTHLFQNIQNAQLHKQGGWEQQWW